jgi:hypothetical protein
LLENKAERGGFNVRSEIYGTTRGEGFSKAGPWYRFYIRAKEGGGGQVDDRRVHFCVINRGGATAVPGLGVYNGLGADVLWHDVGVLTESKLEPSIWTKTGEVGDRARPWQLRDGRRTRPFGEATVGRQNQGAFLVAGVDQLEE